MKLFRREKKSEPKKETIETNGQRQIKILGSGCPKCMALEETSKLAADELGLDVEIIHVKDFADIASYGVMATPALVFDEKVLSYGKSLSVEEVKDLLREEAL
ncbi:MAG: thioredoxin family protein [Anaerococcus sp.]|nr:thioredoxin family protein [Anaerococcus sp.]